MSTSHTELKVTGELQGPRQTWLRIFGADGERAGQLLAEISVAEILRAMCSGAIPLDAIGYLRGDLKK